jgi:hypothetical protein
MVTATSAAPSSGDQGVCAAVALGWQVAQLFHSPVGKGPACDPRRGEHLPGRSQFPGVSKSKWLGEQIESEVKALLRTPSQAAPLSASPAADGETERSFLRVLGNGRLITIRDWLADLKTLLPDHTAYAVSRSLHDWEQWAAKPRTADEWRAARSAIGVQGRIWRELLTGEKAAQDILKLSDYHAAALRVARRVITRFWWCIAAATVLIAAIIFAGTYLHSVPLSLRVVGDVAWLAGALGIALKGTGALLGIGLKDVEGWLWRIELDGSVAIAATCLPAGAKPSRVGGGSLGELRPGPQPDAEPQQASTWHPTSEPAANA